MPLTSNSQQNSGSRRSPMTRSLSPTTPSSRSSFAPQGQHGEISPPGQAGRATARSRPRPRPHGHAARFDCIKIVGVTLDYIKVSSSTFVRAKVANIAVDRTKIASSTFDDTLREATPVDPSRGHSGGPREATPVDPS